MYIKFQIKETMTAKLKRARKAIEDAMPNTREILRQEAYEFRDMLQQNLLEQRLPLAPLSTRYRDWKIKQGLDPRTLISTGQYANCFEVVELQSGFKVQVPSGTHNSGMTFRKLAAIHEYGSFIRGIPARPHWGPTIQNFNMNRSHTVSERIGKTFGNALGYLVK